MKKTLYVALAMALFAMNFAPAMADVSVNTGLTRDTTGGTAPVVKAKWEANLDRYTDDSTDSSAQFLPSGEYQINKTISVCAVVTDPDGLADIGNVYADVFYPEGVSLGDSHVALPNQPQNPADRGCGQFMQEDTLTRLPKADGITLFCNSVRNSNNNLPTFNIGYNYDEICATDGELQKDTAAIYCGQKTISYEDPSGGYKVWAIGQDKNGLQGTLENFFNYLPITAFETDFDSVTYGNVRLNTEKIISGDLTWNTTPTERATVRNTGNTRLAMQVQQNDMGLGKTSGLWNVSYRARVGSFSDYATYNPDATTTLDGELDLSEKDEMDFAITISKFPPTHTGDSYTGTMVLEANAVPHLTDCAPIDEPPTDDCSNSNTCGGFHDVAYLQTESDQYFYINDEDQIDLDLPGDFTLEMWLNFDTLPAGDPIWQYNLIDKFDAPNGLPRGMRFYYDAINRLILEIANDTNKAVYILWTPTVGTWYHVAVVNNRLAGTADFYIDGVAMGGQQAPLNTTIVNPTVPFKIGGENSGNGNYNFDGKIDDVRVWNDMRTAQEISDNYQNELTGDEPNLVGYWKFNGDGLDSSPNHNDLTNNNGATFVAR